MRRVEKHLEKVAADIVKSLKERVQIPALIRHMYSAFGCIEAWYSPQCTGEVLQEKLQVILDELHSPRSEEYTELLEDIV